MSELLMDLADCGSPERLIQTILRHHPDWTPPVPIEALAAAVNILEIRDLDTTSFEGALLTDPDKSQGIILCRPGVPGGRRRFTIGHELGHFLIPTHVGNQQCTQAHLSERGFSTPAQRREAEANRFAAGILMPKPWFERDADRLGLPEVGQPRFAPCGLRLAPQALTRSAAAAESLAWIDGSIRFARKRRPEICEGEVTSMRVVLQRTAWRTCMSSRHQNRGRIGAGLRQRDELTYNRPSASPTPGPMISQSPRPSFWRWRRGLARCSTRFWVRASERSRT